MHTVIADECTGCDLCIEPCPVDCIDLIPRKSGIGSGTGRYLRTGRRALTSLPLMHPPRTQHENDS
jgi:Na+-translocating ferredoxin:NAD+ oxidoreductase RNF subunit RnfB